MAKIADERYDELVAGMEWITVRLSNERIVYLRNYTLRHIYNVMKMNKYMQYCGLSCYKDHDFPEMNEYEQILFHKHMTLQFAIFLNEFVMSDDILHDENKDEFIIVNDNNEVRLTQDDVDEILKNFRQVYCLAGGETIFPDAKPITEEGKKDLEIFRKAQAKINAKKSGSITISSIIMGVTSKHQSYNLFNIYDLTVWQLMETHSIMYKLDDIYFTKLGIYTGNIDMKESKIKPEELKWSGRPD